MRLRPCHSSVSYVKLVSPTDAWVISGQISDYCTKNVGEPVAEIRTRDGGDGAYRRGRATVRHLTEAAWIRMGSGRKVSGSESSTYETLTVCFCNVGWSWNNERLWCVKDHSSSRMSCLCHLTCCNHGGVILRRSNAEAPPPIKLFYEWKCLAEVFVEAHVRILSTHLREYWTGDRVGGIKIMAFRSHFLLTR